MSWGWQPVPVTRLRPVMVPDGHGNQRPDWTAPDTEPIGRWLYAPSTTSTEDRVSREHGIHVAGTLYGPPAADVAPGDVVEFEAGRFRLIGTPQTWKPGTVLDVERWDG